MIETSAEQFQRIADLAFQADSDIRAVTSPPDVLIDAQAGAQRIVKLMSEEFVPGFRGHLIEMEPHDKP